MSIPCNYPPISRHNREKGMIDLQSISLQSWGVREYSLPLFQLSSSTSGGWRQNSRSYQTMPEPSLSFLDYRLLKFTAKIILFPCLVAASECSLVLFLTSVFFFLFTVFSFPCYLYPGVPVPGVFSMRHRLPWSKVVALLLKPVQQQLSDRLSECYRKDSWLRLMLYSGASKSLQALQLSYLHSLGL